MLFLVVNFEIFFSKYFFSNENNLGFHMRYNLFRDFDNNPGFQTKTTLLYYFAHDCMPCYGDVRDVNVVLKCQVYDFARAKHFCCFIVYNFTTFLA